MRRQIKETNKTSVNRICIDCGNKLVESGEQCDDGNFVNGDGCSSSCNVETVWECTENKY